ncbi:MAG: cytochrome-c peroxidase [Piscirickettsiaceae bacterium]|nr:MAG: cytochrome-c peroxidase [Piscirickettsiaceae bacterium]
MTKRLISFLLLTIGATAVANNQLGLPPIPIPSDNPQSTKKIALGQTLFNDRRFSTTGTISCASCHQINKAFTDNVPQAIGINGLTGTRNSPTLINSAFLTSYFHDGRRSSLEEQALDPLTNPIEHGLKDHTLVLNIVRNDISYIKKFLDVYQITAEKITMGHVAKSIASFERTLIYGNSPFDRYFFKAERPVLTQSQARGLRLFRRKANCANCHEISWDHALFTDNRFYNIGIGFDNLRIVLPEFLKEIDETVLTSIQRTELGRFSISRQLKDIGAYRTPTLRNIELTAPYMHDGSIDTLEEVVDYYDKGGNKNQFLNPAIFPLNLTKQEKMDLVAFMKILTSPEFKITDKDQKR